MIAVTGASGLLGRHLVDKLLEEGEQVIAVVRDGSARFPEGVLVRAADLMDSFALQEALKGVHAVVHCAALVSFNPRRRSEIMRVNVEGTRNLVNICLQERIPNLIQISSVSALGRKPGVLIREEDPWTDQYATDYATSKYLAELEVFRGAEEGLTVGLVNPSVILSGNPLHRSSGSLFDYVWRGRRFYTEGTFNYVDARDVSDAVYSLIRNPRPGERFILSAGNISYFDFFSRLARHWQKRSPSIRIPHALVAAFGFTEEIRCWLTGREPLVTRQSAAMTVRDFRYDNSKGMNILGVRYRTLDETVEWCCAQYAQHVSGNK